MKLIISRRILRTGLPLFLILVVTSLGVAQTSSTMLTDAEAQALIQKFQSQPAVPLTRTETHHLLKYLIAKSPQQSAATPMQQQAQSAAMLVHTRTPAAQDSGTVQLAASVSSKKLKAIHIGIALPKADLGQGFQGQSAGEPVRLLMSQYLGGPAIEVVTLAALLPQQIEAEAKEKGCDYIVYSSMIQTQKKNGMGFLKGASSMMGMIPMVGAAAGAAGAIAATAAASAASGAATMACQVKAKSDVTFEYHMFVPGNATPVLENKATAKAKTDGEDVITPLVEAAAASILGKVAPAPKI